MVKNYPCTSVLCVLLPLVVELMFACLDTMRSRLPAKRSASRRSVDVLARTPQAHNRGLCFPFPRACGNLIRVCDFAYDSPLAYLFSPPTPDKPFVFLVHDLGMTLIELKDLPYLTDSLQPSSHIISLSSGYIRSSSKTTYVFYRAPCVSPVPP
jgi:hypothetical protein